MLENVDEFLLCRTYVGIWALVLGRFFPTEGKKRGGFFRGVVYKRGQIWEVGDNNWLTYTWYILVIGYNVCIGYVFIKLKKKWIGNFWVGGKQ